MPKIYIKKIIYHFELKANLTDFEINIFSRIHRPVFSYDPHIHATTQEWNGVSVKITHISGVFIPSCMQL